MCWNGWCQPTPCWCPRISTLPVPAGCSAVFGSPASARPAAYPPRPPRRWQGLRRQGATDSCCAAGGSSDDPRARRPTRQPTPAPRQGRTALPLRPGRLRHQKRRGTLLQPLQALAWPSNQPMTTATRLHRPDSPDINTTVVGDYDAPAFRSSFHQLGRLLRPEPADSSLSRCIRG